MIRDNSPNSRSVAKLAEEAIAESWGQIESGEIAGCLKSLDLAIAILRPVHRPPPENGRRVVCRTDPRRWWPSIADAARGLGVASTNSVSEAIRTGGTCRGVFLRFEDTPEEQCPPMRQKDKPVSYDGKAYPSIVEAARENAPNKNYKAAHEWARRNVQRI